MKPLKVGDRALSFDHVRGVVRWVTVKNGMVLGERRNLFASEDEFLAHWRRKSAEGVVASMLPRSVVGLSDETLEAIISELRLALPAPPRIPDAE
jgi:hypothetical protein